MSAVNFEKNFRQLKSAAKQCSRHATVPEWWMCGSSASPNDKYGNLNMRVVSDVDTARKLLHLIDTGKIYYPSIREIPMSIALLALRENNIVLARHIISVIAPYFDRIMFVGQLPGVDDSVLATVERSDALSSNHTVNDSFIAKWVSSTVDHGQSTAYQLILEVRAMAEQKKAIPQWVLYASEFMKIPYAAYGHDIKRFLALQTNFSPGTAKTIIRQCIDNGGVLGACSGVNNSHHEGSSPPSAFTTPKKTKKKQKMPAAPRKKRRTSQTN
jgi:hypothetical protein